MEFRRVGVCGQLQRNVDFPSVVMAKMGCSETTVTVSWTLATVKEGKEKEKAHLEQVTVSFISCVGSMEEEMQLSKLHYS